jgi:hypothetical protein
MADDWTLGEVETVVADYFAMLRAELSGESYSKSVHRRALLPQLHGRSEQSIEFKHANISAVLVAYGLPYIDGYKPRPHYQQLLEQGVLEFVAATPDFFDRLLQTEVLSPDRKPDGAPKLSEIEEPPPEALPTTPRTWDPERRIIRIDFVRRDAENRRLGRLGEEFVMEMERQRLHDAAQRPDLAAKVEWTSEQRGDGAGYDIASFEANGRPRYIEVKTTGLAKAFPFCVTANEVACSDTLNHQYHLYRLFRFSRRPGVYILSGRLSETCHLDPIQYRARFA